MKKAFIFPLILILYLLIPTSVSFAQDDWNLLNPYPTMNDLESVFFIDPNVGWAVGDLGTIIKTLDGGENWQTVGKFVELSLTDVFFINYTDGWACGSYGVILRTTDGGDTWEKIATGVPEYFNRIYFSSSTEGIAMYIGGFYKTSDGGSSWRRITGSWIYLNDMHFMDPMNGWAVGGGPASSFIALQTTDGGETWDLKGPPGQGSLWCLFFVNDSTGWAGSESGVMYRTTNAGLSWTAKQTLTNLTFNSVKFVNKFFGIAVAGLAMGGTVMRTNDGGVSWQELETGSEWSFYDLSLIDTQTGLLTGFGGEIYKTTNGGDIWHCEKKNQIPEEINSIFFTNHLNGWIAAQNGLILNTTDGGNTWSPKVSGGTTHFKQIQFTDDLNGYAIGLEWYIRRYSIILKTTDGGSNWDTVFFQNQIPLFNFHFLNERVGWAVGWYSQVFKTTDGGSTWQDLSFFQYRDFYAVKFMDELTGYATGYPGIVYKTTDGGISWQQLSTGARGYLRSLHFVSQDTILAVGGYVSSGVPKGEIIKSTDGGQTWSHKDDGIGQILLAAYFTSPDTGFVTGESRSLYKTTDRGETWIKQTVHYTGDYRSLFFIDSMTGWLGGSEGVLLKTTNGGGVTSVSEEIPFNGNLKAGYELFQNYPNPFNPSTNIVFNLKTDASATLTIYNVLGEVVKSEYIERLVAGINKIHFNATGLSSGVYFYRISGTAEDKSETFYLSGKMLLSK